MARSGMPNDIDWRKQDPSILGKVATLVRSFSDLLFDYHYQLIQARSRNEHLQNYEHNWAALEIMRTILKNKRNYRKKIGRSTSNSTYEEPDCDRNSEDGNQENADHDGQEQDDAFSVSGDDNDEDEEGDSGSGKRKMARQGGTGGKRAKV